MSGEPVRTLDLINRGVVEVAMAAKLDQLTDYHASLVGRTDEVGVHARTVAFGRIMQLENDMTLLTIQPSGFTPNPKSNVHPFESVDEGQNTPGGLK